MTLLFDHPYALFLERVIKPSRYAGGEYGARVKDFGRTGTRVCLAFPDVHEIGSSHLGLRILYQILNDHPGILAERCFAPWKDLEAELRAENCPLVSLESARPLRDFDVVGFSLQYELCYTNVLAMLELGRIPRWAAERDENDPLVIAGGPVTSHIEPFAPFLDAVLIGEGEEALVEIALAWTQAKERGLGRAERLIELCRIRGVYVPSLYRTAIDPASGREVVLRASPADVPLPVERRWIADLDRFPFPAEGPVGGPEAVFDRLSVEIARGCIQGCRFCQAGMIYRPARERDPVSVLGSVGQGLEYTGWDEVSLAALSTADVSYIAPLIRELTRFTTPERVSLSVASLRAYGLSQELLAEMGRVRAGGLTCAPEAGTGRLRDVINKNVTERDLLDTAERVFRTGGGKLKLYFMLGLPTETTEDVVAIGATGRATLAVGKRFSGRCRVTLSVSNHVPKPHTPFQWCAMDTRAELWRKQALLRQELRGARGIDLRLHDVDTSLLEGVLARGDRRLARVIEHAYLHGARFDAWEGELAGDRWLEAFEAMGLDPSDYLGALPVGGRLPWDHLDVGLLPRFLEREHARALAGKPSPPCTTVHREPVNLPDTPAPGLLCYDCGVDCDLVALGERRTQALAKLRAREPLGPPPPPDPDPTSARLPEARRPPQPGGDRVRWRLGYEKTGPAVLHGHLDWIRELSRVLRRAGLRIAYSLGFHPKPQLSMPPALPVGVSSLGECLDLKLIDAPRPDELLARLEQATRLGLRFFSARPLQPEDASLSALIDRAEYVIGFGPRELGELGGLDALGELVQRFLEAPSLPVQRRSQGKPKWVDARSFVEKLSLDGEHAGAVLHRAGATTPLSGVVMQARILGSGAVRPSDVVEALVGRPGVVHAAVRARLLHGDTPVWDVDALRAGTASGDTEAPEAGGPATRS